MKQFLAFLGCNIKMCFRYLCVFSMNPIVFIRRGVISLGEEAYCGVSFYLTKDLTEPCCTCTLQFILPPPTNPYFNKDLLSACVVVVSDVCMNLKRPADTILMDPFPNTHFF